jgi:hypothetical protein
VKGFKMTSDWMKRSIRRRDERNTKGEIKPKPRVGNKKDTKKWCRGVKGRSHQPKCIDYKDIKNAQWAPANWKVYICQECSKVLDYYWPSEPFIRKPEKPPAWVTEQGQ